MKLDIPTITGILTALSGFVAVVVGLVRNDLPVMTFGAGLLGAPGFALALKKDQNG